VRGSRLFNPYLTLLHRFSIGLKSGEYGGRYSSSAPAVSMASGTPTTLWVDRLTTSSRCNTGASPCFNQAKNSSPSISARQTFKGLAALGVAHRQSWWSSDNVPAVRDRPAADRPGCAHCVGSFACWLSFQPRTPVARRARLPAAGATVFFVPPRRAATARRRPAFFYSSNHAG